MKIRQLFPVFVTALTILLSNAAWAQVKIGNNYTTIGASSNLEVEATNGNKTIVDKATGQVTIQDGTQGVNKVLTSDVNGASSWQSLTTQRIPETVWIGEQSGSYTITPFAGFDNLKDRIPLVPRLGSIAGYNTATKQYTIQVDGYYRIHAGAFMVGTLAAAGTTCAVYLSNFNVFQSFKDVSTGAGPVLSIFWEGYMTAGTVFDTYVISTANVGGPSNQNLTVSRTFMSITKLF